MKCILDHIANIASSVRCRLQIWLSCLYECLHVSPPASQKPHIKASPNFLRILHVTVGRSSSHGVAIYKLPVLLDDVMFASNRQGKDGASRAQAQQWLTMK